MTMNARGKTLHNARAGCYAAGNIDTGTLRTREKRRWRKEEW